MGPDPACTSDLSCLPPADRLAVRTWLHRMRPAGFDRIEDLGHRDWADPRPDVILGVFRRHERLAGWLLAGSAGSWAVACCADGSVSRAYPSLAAALRALTVNPRRTPP